MLDISVGLKLHLTGSNNTRGSVKGHRRLLTETKGRREREGTTVFQSFIHFLMLAISHSVPTHARYQKDDYGRSVPPL